MSPPALSRRLLLSGLATATLGAPAALARVPEDAQVALWRGMALDGVDGRTFQLGTGRAALTLVKLWANWCPACLGEMASLAALAASMPADTLDVMLVSHPEYWRQDVAAAHRRQLPFRLGTPSAGTDPGVVRAALTLDGAYDVPRSFVFRGRDNSIAWSHLGSMDWAAAPTASRLRSLAG